MITFNMINWNNDQSGRWSIGTVVNRDSGQSDGSQSDSGQSGRWSIGTVDNRDGGQSGLWSILLWSIGTVVNRDGSQSGLWSILTWPNGTLLDSCSREHLCWQLGGLDLVLSAPSRAVLYLGPGYGVVAAQSGVDWTRGAERAAWGANAVRGARAVRARNARRGVRAVRARSVIYTLYLLLTLWLPRRNHMFCSGRHGHLCYDARFVLIFSLLTF